MHRASRLVLDKDQPAVGKRRPAANAFVVDSDPTVSLSYKGM